MAAAEAASAVRRAKGPRPLWRTRAEAEWCRRTRVPRSGSVANEPRLLARAAPAARLRVARRPHGLRACWARPSADRRIRGAPPTASRRSAAPKGKREAELPWASRQRRACTNIDTEAQKKAAEYQRLSKRVSRRYLLLTLHWLQQLNEQVFRGILGDELRTLALLA